MLIRPGAMSYSVKEIFYTLQGEGVQAGRPAVFCRFSGCNLWTGRESDRERAVCKFCDTDFVGMGPTGGRFQDPHALAAKIEATWPRATGGRRFVVCTGGEPLLQLDAALVRALHARDFEVAIETNGTLDLVDGIDWVCASPKAGANFVLTRGDELKLIYPQPGAEPGRFEQLAFKHFLLQPMDDGPRTREHTERALRYCLEHPQWRLSLQTHKLLGIP